MEQAKLMENVSIAKYASTTMSDASDQLPARPEELAKPIRPLIQKVSHGILLQGNQDGNLMDLSNWAKECNQLYKELAFNYVEKGIQLGGKLVIARDQMGWGGFISWLSAHCIFQKAQAYEYIKLYENKAKLEEWMKYEKKPSIAGAIRLLEANDPKKVAKKEEEKKIREAAKELEAPGSTIEAVVEERQRVSMQSILRMIGAFLDDCDEPEDRQLAINEIRNYLKMREALCTANR